MTNYRKVKPLGGYFELELPKKEYGIPYQNAIAYQSARSAFRALLEFVRPKKVWVPKYICDAMIAPLIDVGISYDWYDLDEWFNVPSSLVLEDNELLLYVNYYGVCQRCVDDILNRFPAKQVVYDFSQAFFDVPRSDALATIYSLRKFLGVPDGGFLVTDIPIQTPSIEDDGSIERMTHLLKRLYDEPENGYSDYLSSENTLINTMPKKMSRLTQRLLNLVDYYSVQKKRADNFRHLHEKLKELNLFDFTGIKVISPLCYPFIIDEEGLRDRLINNRVFVPTYWNDALERVENGWGRRNIKNFLPLPIDQRYSKHDMDNLASLIMESIK